MLTTVVDHIVWSAIAATQAVNLPFGVTITAQNIANGAATGFTGPVALSAATTGVLSTNTIVGSLGASQTQTDHSYNWTFGYAFTPNTNLQVISVRTYSGSKVTIWTDGGTFITSQNVTSPAGVWTETPLDTPITLSGGATYRLTVYYPTGTTRVRHLLRPRVAYDIHQRHGWSELLLYLHRWFPKQRGGHGGGAVS